LCFRDEAFYESWVKASDDEVSMEKKVIYSTEPEDFYYTAVNVPCQAACPAATNIPAYIRALYEEQYGRSYEINRLANMLPGVLGRVCSRPCEDQCRHGEAELGHPVNICHIKRAAADLKQRVPKAEEGPFAFSGKRLPLWDQGLQAWQRRTIFPPSGFP
jgi:glutamate synthase (NADPH) small chain